MIVILNVKIFKSKQFKCPLVIKLERKIKKKKKTYVIFMKRIEMIKFLTKEL